MTTPSESCVYHERDRTCHETPVFSAQIDGRNLRLCERHAQPEFWPADMRKRLPGRLQRLKVALARRHAAQQQYGGRP